MRKLLVTFILLFGLAVSSEAQQSRLSSSQKSNSATTPNYFGCWSDGSGSFLFVRRQKIKYGQRGKWVKYADITETPDGKSYLLKLFNPGQFNFLSNIITLSRDGEKMQMTLYKSLTDYSKDKRLGWDT